MSKIRQEIIDILNTKMSKLVPCPVCGIKEGYFLVHNHDGDEERIEPKFYDICCNNCYAAVAVSKAGENADEAWNDAGAYAESMRLRLLELEQGDVV